MQNICKEHGQGKVAALVTVAAAAFAAVCVEKTFADAPPWQDGAIVIDSEGTYTLDSDASATGIYFMAPATLTGSATLTLTPPAVIYGSGTVEVPLAGTDGMCVSNAWASSKSVFPQKDTWTPIWTNAKLALIEEIDAAIYGSYDRAWIDGTGHLKYWDTKTVAFTKSADGTTASAQFHVKLTTRVDAFKVAFRQNGSDVEAQLVWVKYTSNFENFGLDWDNGVTGLSTRTDATFNSSTLGVTYFRGRTAPLTFHTSSLPSGGMSFNAGYVTVSPTTDITITSAMSGSICKLQFLGDKTDVGDSSPLVTITPDANNTLTNSLADIPSFVFDGIDAKFTTRATYAMPARYEIVLTNNAVLADDAAYPSDAKLQFRGNRFYPYTVSAPTPATLYVPITNAIVVTRGSKLAATKGDWDFTSPLEVKVDGGVMDIGAKSHRLNRLILANGATLTGNPIIGTEESDMRLTSSGEEASVISGRLIIGNPNVPGTPYVIETYGDLTVSEGLKQWYSAVCDIIKKGPATLTLGNNASLAGAPGAVWIDEGSVKLAANGAFSRTNDVTLAGGSINMDSFTNRLGVLTLSANSSIEVGAGQLIFSDSSAAAWGGGAKLLVTGNDEKLKAGRIRFLTNGGAGLTDAQLKAIRYNGARVVLDGDGWLRSASGMVLLVR